MNCYNMNCCKFMALEPSLALKSWNLLTSTKPWDTARREFTHWLSPVSPRLHLTATLGGPPPIHH